MHVLAYLDPGSGSMVLQMVLGGVASAAVAVKMFGKRLWSHITFWKKDEATPAKPVSAEAAAPPKDPA